MLIEKGANVNAVNEYNSSALILAAFNGTVPKTCISLCVPLIIIDEDNLDSFYTAFVTFDIY